MTERCEWDDDLGSVEAMVRAAGRYVRASDDLRPRVIEEARFHRGERVAQRCVRRAAMFMLLLALLTIATPCGLEDQSIYPSSMLAAAGFNELMAPAANPTLRSGDGDWRMIDAFTELRRQQAQVLRLSL
jgi:hypothetical protein